MQESRVAGVILTGGQSRRMGGKVKAHMLLAGKPLIQHVIDRTQSQVKDLALSVERLSAEYESYGLVQLADPIPGSCGPLGGLLSALSILDDGCDWLLLVPCDAPFLPLNLAAQLLGHALEKDEEACVVRYRTELQPTFSVWHKSLLPALESAVMEQGMGGFKQFLRWKPMAVLDWEESAISPFFNINDPAALARAQQCIEEGLAA